MQPGITAEPLPSDKICQQTADFIGRSLHGEIWADIGSANKKAKFLEQKLNGKSIELTNDDFNVIPLKEGKFSVITCFEVIEHLQNPLFLMQQLSDKLTEDGVIYLSTPARPKILWPPYHFYEMPFEHLDKWLFKPVGLKVVRRGRIFQDHPLWFYFTGPRPFLRLFYDHTNIYELRKI
jgi:SAM-dependent methyltransferase